jgi:hypothetical protein
MRPSRITAMRVAGELAGLAVEQVLDLQEPCRLAHCLVALGGGNLAHLAAAEPISRAFDPLFSAILKAGWKALRAFHRVTETANRHTFYFYAIPDGKPSHFSWELLSPPLASRRRRKPRQ